LGSKLDIATPHNANLTTAPFTKTSENNVIVNPSDSQSSTFPVTALSGVHPGTGQIALVQTSATGTMQFVYIGGQAVNVNKGTMPAHHPTTSHPTTITSALCKSSETLTNSRVTASSSSVSNDLVPESSPTISREKKSKRKNSDINPHADVKFITDQKYKIPLSEGDLKQVAKTLLMTSNSPAVVNPIPVRQNKCYLCKIWFTEKIYLYRHEKFHLLKKTLKKPQPHKCKLCKKYFRWEKNFLCHEKSHPHTKKGVKNHLLCPYCHESFTTRKAKTLLINHISLIHTSRKPFKCRSCGRKFKTKDSYIRHQSMHTGRTPFICEYCNRAFKTEKDLDSHVRTHSEEKPHLCKYCGKAFAWASHLYLHEQSHQRLKCPMCPKKFSSQEGLSQHNEIHTNKEPLLCRHCGEKFQNFHSRKQHEFLRHSGERPYKCKLCDKTYRWQASLDAHVETHSDERPFECNQCGKAYKNKGNLRRHEGLCKHSEKELNY
jgi:hypothetical protein